MFCVPSRKNSYFLMRTCTVETNTFNAIVHKSMSFKVCNTCANSSLLSLVIAIAQVASFSPWAPINHKSVSVLSSLCLIWSSCHLTSWWILSRSLTTVTYQHIISYISYFLFEDFSFCLINLFSTPTPVQKFQ